MLGVVAERRSGRLAKRLTASTPASRIACDMRPANTVSTVARSPMAFAWAMGMNWPLPELRPVLRGMEGSEMEKGHPVKDGPLVRL